MGLLGSLLGRGKPAPIPWTEALKAMAAAAPRLQGELETLPTGQAALLVRPALPWAEGPAQPPATAGTAAEVEAALAPSPGAIGASPPPAPGNDFRVQADADGHSWVVASAAKLEELAAALARATEALKAKGMEERILAAVFPFTWKETRLYWICRFKTGRYSPFAAVPGSEQLRDYPLELRMEAALRKDLPTERDLSQWYPIWGMPI